MFIHPVSAFTVAKAAVKLKNVTQCYMKATEQKKRDLINRFYLELGTSQAMIFVNTKKTAEFLKDLLEKLGKSAQVLTSKMTDAERDAAIGKFRAGVFSALISTNVLARGIDVPAVDVVINYDIPKTYDYGYMEPDTANYLHRIGRTGRFGTDGLALTFYTDEVEE